jgi:hypothetical protein
VFDGSLEAGEILAKGIRDGCESAVSLGVKILCPAAGAKVDAIYMAIDWAFEAKVEGVDQATKDFFVKIVIKAILKDVKFVSLDYDTLENYVNGVASKVPLEELLNNMEFMTEFESQLRTVMFDKVVNEGIKEAIENEEIREAIIKSVRDHLRSSVASLKANAKCPVELRVFGVSGETGLQSGEVRHDIPMSFYYNGTITLFSGTDCYCYQVQGIGLGSYNLEITLTGEGETTTFDALNISTSQGVLHQYTVNWSALSRNEKGVTIMVDSDGDRVFESALASGSELNSTQFAAGMHHATDINGDGKVDIVDLVALALAFRCRPADSKWNPAADFNCDQTIDILDIFRLAMDFGKTF